MTSIDEEFIIRNVDVIELIEDFLKPTPKKIFNGKEYLLRSIEFNNNTDGRRWGYSTINIQLFCLDNDEHYYGTLLKQHREDDNLMFKIMLHAAEPKPSQINCTVSEPMPTLTIRDVFANQILSALISREYKEPVKNAYLLAEEMLKEKKKYDD